jgi:5-methylthioadenosine/S-adenosylhomocysteine deaminase
MVNGTVVGCLPLVASRLDLRLSAFICVCFFFSASGVEAQTRRQKVDVLVVGGSYITMDAARNLYADGAMAVRGDSIVGIGPRAEITAKYWAPRRINGAGRIILPGFINGHGHAPMVLLRGLADDLALQEWLTKFIFPAEARNVNADFVEWGTRLAVLEMIRGGTTTYADMYYFEDVIARVTKEAGMRGVLGETILEFPAPDNKTVPQGLAYVEEFLKKWQGDPLIHAAVAPHSVYLATEDTLRKTAALARKYRAPILIHLSETRKENDDARAQFGASPTVYLDRIGFLGPDVLAAHCIWMDAADIALISKHQVGCVHNPSSNMKLSSGPAPVVSMLAAGVRLGLATDGPSGSNNDLNMMEEMDLAAKLAKVTTMDPQAVNAQQALAMATIEGARALHMEKEIGSLETGKKADFILLRTDAPHAVPMFNLYSHVVYALKASDVETVVINGRIVMHGRRMLTLNEMQILIRAREYAAKVTASLK